MRLIVRISSTMRYVSGMAPAVNVDRRKLHLYRGC